MSTNANADSDFNFCFPVPDALESERVLLTPFIVCFSASNNSMQPPIWLVLCTPPFLNPAFKARRVIHRSNSPLSTNLWPPPIRTIQRYRWLHQELLQYQYPTEPWICLLRCLGQNQTAYCGRESRRSCRHDGSDKQFQHQSLDRDRLHHDLAAFPAHARHVQCCGPTFKLYSQPALPPGRSTGP